jgi:CubicO group peptidase (beta-lactamase class C family)
MRDFQMLRFVTRLLLPCLVLLAGSGPPAWAGQTPLPWVARHGLSAADYQKAFDEFGKDFELASVSGYLDNGALRYAALWRKPASAEPWAARHGLSTADFTKAIDDLAKDGLSLIYVDGYEVGGTPLFAGIWRKSAAGLPVVKLGMNDAHYEAELESMHKAGFSLQYVAGYTHSGVALYAAIWNKAGGPDPAERHNLTGPQYQLAFDDFAKQGYRLKEVSGYSPGGVDHYAAIWEKGGDGAPWIADNGVPLSGYQTSFDIDRYQGWQPLYVQAFTSGGSARFDTIWESPFKGADLDALQSKLLKATQSVKVAGLSIAIARNGHLLYASGLGMADKEAGIPMNVNHRLRVGSVSKSITSTTIFRLIQSGATYGGGKKLTLDSPIMGPDGILPDLQAPPQLPQFASAKLHHVLEHTAGLPGNLSNEEVLDPTNCSAGNLVQRINAVIAQVKPIPAPPAGGPANGGPVPRAPGIMFDYSNIDFAIAQAVIERVKPGPYAATVMQQVFAPAGLTQPALFHTGPYDASLGEAKQYSRDGSYAQYSTCDNLPPGVGAGGWDMSAKDLLRYLVSVDGLTPPTDILNANERTDMLHTPAQDNPADKTLNTGYARGWQIGGWGACSVGWNIVQGHNGGINGGFSDMFFLAEGGFSFVLIANQEAAASATCTPNAPAGAANPAPIACGGTNQPVCADEPMARTIDLIRRVDWPNYDLF